MPISSTLTDEYKRDRRNRFLETGDRFAMMLKAKGYRHILDLGCGENLYKDVPGVVGVDVDPMSCDVVADMCCLPYKDGFFDCILVFGSLVFGGLPYPPSIDPHDVLEGQMRELHRVLCITGDVYGRTSHIEILNDRTISSIGKKLQLRYRKTRIYYESGVWHKTILLGMD